MWNGIETISSKWHEAKLKIIDAFFVGTLKNVMVILEGIMKNLGSHSSWIIT